MRLTWFEPSASAAKISQLSSPSVVARVTQASWAPSGDHVDPSRSETADVDVLRIASVGIHRPDLELVGPVRFERDRPLAPWVTALDSWGTASTPATQTRPVSRRASRRMSAPPPGRRRLRGFVRGSASANAAVRPRTGQRCGADYVESPQSPPSPLDGVARRIGAECPRRVPEIGRTGSTSPPTSDARLDVVSGSHRAPAANGGDDLLRFADVAPDL